MNFDPVTKKGLLGKGPSDLEICKNGPETTLVEEAVGLADTEVVLVFWEAGKLLGEV